MTDPIADLLTRIRNGGMAGHETVTMPHSRLKEMVARVLVRKGYVAHCAVRQDENRNVLVLTLRYFRGHRPVIMGLQRVSRPGRRVYADRRALSTIKRGVGLAILTTSSGLLTDRECRRKGVGGEVLCYVW